MKLLSMAMLLVTASVTFPAAAQKVVRKGMIPTTRHNAAKTVFYNTGQLSGKWQEVQRLTAATSSPVDFRDSLLLNFNKRDSVYVYDGVTMSQRGVVAIEGPNSLSLAGDTYTIVGLTKSMMILNDGEYIRTFKKTNRFHHETLGKLKANVESHEKPMQIQQAKLAGRWDVYRRQANPGTADTVLVKSITYVNVKDSLVGTISYYSSGTTNTENFSGYLSGTTMYVTTPGRQWQWDTFKADGEEFVFGKDKEIIYYAKKF